MNVGVKLLNFIFLSICELKNMTNNHDTLYTQPPCWQFCLVDLILVISCTMTSLLLHCSCTLWPHHGYCLLMASQYYIWVQREVNEEKMPTWSLCEKGVVHSALSYISMNYKPYMYIRIYTHTHTLFTIIINNKYENSFNNIIRYANSNCVILHDFEPCL